MQGRADVRRFDHVGPTVAIVTAFFMALGLDVEVSDTVCGFPDTRTEIVMLKPPDNGTRPELSRVPQPLQAKIT